MISIQVDDQEMRQAFTRLVASAKNPRPVLQQIGELLVDSTRQRFGTSTAPDGTPWAKNSETTLMRYLGKYKGAFSKRDGKLTKTGAGRAAGKKPLIGETSDLSRQIHYGIEGGTLAVGSTMIYGAMQQFGGKKAEFPNLWGDIPARPFLGISEQDSRNILAEISDYLNQSARP
jgi:phage virion morphogenesis protein